jgi:hypothetical protein
LKIRNFLEITTTALGAGGGRSNRPALTKRIMQLKHLSYRSISRQQRTPEQWFELSLTYYRARRYPDAGRRRPRGLPRAKLCGSL